MDFKDIYLSEINRVFNSYADNKKVCLFFKGFNAEFFSILNYSGNKGINNKLYVNDDFSIDVEQLEKNKSLVLINFLQLTEPISWGYYEELIALCDSWNDIEKQENTKIVVIDNNLFCNCYPLTIEPKLAERLANYINNEEKENEELEILMNYYSDVTLYLNKCCGIVYNEKDSLCGFEKVNFYDEDQIEPIYSDVRSSDNNVVSQINLFEVKNNLQNGMSLSEFNITVGEEKEIKQLRSFIYVIKKLNLKYSIGIKDRFKLQDNVDEHKYLPILKKYWGNDKNFRKINIYKKPEESNEVTEISQGTIISNIIKQANNALDGKENFIDVFITAPTGSGKSLLFQIPAIYLHNERNAITIVITPLIALMRDQVEQLNNDRNIKFATFLNSEISFEEKEARIRKIKNGEISIVYMAPELLLGSSLENIVGHRRIGLLIVDEAHIVTTWGRDFRADYWFLGTYIQKLRKTKEKEKNFPIVCLTATAVYMGSEDTVNDTINTLGLNTPQIYLGNVRRKNIGFDINLIDRKSIEGGFEEFKLKKSHERIIELLAENKKSVIYCPFTTHIEQLMDLLENDIKDKVGIYYGTYDKLKKIEAQQKFKSGEHNIMMCTKAFGMGIDISDISTVYHFAPTGNLSDYVQEIGRVARDENIKGCAKTDFTKSDLKYARMLSSLSAIKQYQLKEILRKLYNIYNEKRKRNILISPETFSYLFGDNNLENRVKTSLLLLEKDLNKQFNVLVVRPKSIFTKNFINVPNEVNEIFVEKYGQFSKKIKENTNRILPGSYKNGDITISNYGIIYEVNMSEVWENHFSDLTFPDFKRRFFNGELFELGDEMTKLSPRVHLLINYAKELEECKNLLREYCNMLSSIFSYFSRESKFFTKADFKKIFKSKFTGTFATQDLSDIILDMFVADTADNIGFNQNKYKYKFVQARKSQSGQMELEYRVMNSNYSTFGNYLIRQLMQCSPNCDNNIHSSYIAISKGDKKTDILQLSIMLELFGLATYEVVGGKNTEIFVRINDPLKIKRLSNGVYKNGLLTEIESKKRKSQEILMQFMCSKLTDEERWDVIENYFLGNEEFVEDKLGIIQN